MKSQRIINIITKFVDCITVVYRIISIVLLFLLTSIYNQPQVINTATVYKASHDNIRPLCASSHTQGERRSIPNADRILYRSPIQIYYI